MHIDNHVDKDLEEIFLHVKKLKAEYGKNEDVNKEKLVNVKKITDNLLNKNVENDESLAKNNLKSSNYCDICGQEFLLEKNLSGLVLLNKFFACEECCKHASNETLNSWIKTRNAKIQDAKPIALLVMQKKNKTRLI